MYRDELLNKVIFETEMLNSNATRIKTSYGMCNESGGHNNRMAKNLRADRLPICTNGHIFLELLAQGRINLSMQHIKISNIALSKNT